MNKGILWLVLTEESNKKLLKVAPPIYSNVFAHHVTLHHDTYLTNKYKDLIGNTKEITLKNNCYNEKIQAVTICLTNITSQNEFPHITISAQDDVKGVESNSLLRVNNNSTPIDGEITIEGLVEFKEFSK